MSSTNIQLKLRQTQQLSQNMQQSLRVLQMSGIEIEREVEDWLADNPLLDRVEQPEKTYEPPQTTADIAKRGVSLDDDDSSAWETSPKKKRSTPICINKLPNTRSPHPKPPACIF